MLWQQEAVDDGGGNGDERVDVQIILWIGTGTNERESQRGGERD